MNQLAHVCLTYFVLSFIIPDTQRYLLPIAIFAIILDLDHIPGYVKMLFISRKERTKMKLMDYIGWFRTAIQEPIGVLTVEALLLCLYLLGTRSEYLAIASMAIALHWLIDFLTVHTRPFDPIDKRVVCLFFDSKKQRVMSEIAITIVSMILFCVVYF